MPANDSLEPTLLAEALLFVPAMAIGMLLAQRFSGRPRGLQFGGILYR